MSYFLSSNPLIPNSSFVVDADEAKHLLLSRRIKVGEEIELQDPTGKRFLCTVSSTSKKTLTVQVVRNIPVPPELTRRIHVYQSFVQEQALDFIIQKTTELGAHALHIVQTEYSPSRVRPEKLDRWQKISLEAAKQSGRARGLDISIESFADALAVGLPAYYLSQDAKKVLPAVIKKGKVDIALWIGPEGGWSKAEIKQFAQRGIEPVSLKGFTLRSETAAVAAVAVVAQI